MMVLDFNLGIHYTSEFVKFDLPTSEGNCTHTMEVRLKTFTEGIKSVSGISQSPVTWSNIFLEGFQAVSFVLSAHNPCLLNQ